MTRFDRFLLIGFILVSALNGILAILRMCGR
jgi:hypothetical protein